MMSSTFYDSKVFFDTLLWSDVFKGPEDFISKIGSVGGIDDAVKLTELYEILALKYVRAHTRYTDEFAFIMAIKRELQVVWPMYLQQKALIKEVMELSIDRIRKSYERTIEGSGTRKGLINIVENMDEPITEASKVPIDNLSTSQSSNKAEVADLNRESLMANELDSIMNKYRAVQQDYVSRIYAKTDELFRVILSDDVMWLYPEGEEEQ